MKLSPDAANGFLAGCVVTAAVMAALHSRDRRPSKDAPRNKPTPSRDPDRAQPSTAIIPPVATRGAADDSLPRDADVVTHSAYVAKVDRRTRLPKWVVEDLSPSSLHGGSSRDGLQFKEEPAVPRLFRATLADYRGSGYDRGHMAPAGFHKSSDAEMAATFHLSNVCPQVGRGFNRDYWARLEEFARRTARAGGHTRVITGPLFLPTSDGNGHWHVEYPVLGQPPGVVAVPTHFFKVVAVQLGDGRTGVGCFVLPNAVIDNDRPLTDFVVPLRQLEAAAGLELLPAVFPFGDSDAHSSSLADGVVVVEASALPVSAVTVPALPGVVDAVHGNGTGAAAAETTSTTASESLPVVSDAVPVPVTAPSTSASATVLPLLPRSSATPAVELCTAVKCELPPPNFWQPKAASAATTPPSA